MKKIFISSTYQDLSPHRNRVWELLKTYEVEVRGMEEFGARTAKPLQTCLDEVSESDIFIGIIGMRYGSIDLESNKSFTQREYEVAIEQGKEILIYLFDEKEGKISPSLIDFEHHAKLEEFKSLLKRSHTIDTFISENDLAEKLERKLDQIFIGKTSAVFRPDRIESVVHHFNLNDERWIAVIGILFGRPIEIFSGLAEDFWIPSWVTNGWTVLTIPDGKHERYDFQFEDRQGYKITIEGVSRSFNMSVSKCNKIITRLLMNDTKIDLILDTLNDFPFSEIIDEKAYCQGIIDALSNTPIVKMKDLKLKKGQPK
jgi:hypothetical protein